MSLQMSISAANDFSRICAPRKTSFAKTSPPVIFKRSQGPIFFRRPSEVMMRRNTAVPHSSTLCRLRATCQIPPAKIAATV